MKIRTLRVNQIEEPVGYDSSRISFSWILDPEGKPVKNVRTYLRVYQESVMLYQSAGLDTDAGIDFSVSLDLQPRTRYDWQVEIFADGNVHLKADSYFETGKKNEPWKADWISPVGETQTAAVLRKEFELEKMGEHARIYMCGLGLYELFLNGKKVGDEYLTPGYHSYDFHLQIQTYDVTELLCKGKNTILIYLAEGWFKGRLGFDGGYRNLYGDRLYAVCELYVGKTQTPTVKTDETWETWMSPISFADIYDGEICNGILGEKLLRLEQELFQGYAKKCVPRKCGALTDRYNLPIRKKEVFIGKKCLTPKGEVILDFGQNLTGWICFQNFMKKAGQIRFRAAEILQDGCFYRENLRTAKAEFVYISNGRKEWVRPHFTFYGFRYMLVEYKEDTKDDWKPLTDLNEGQIQAWHLRSDIEQIGFFETENERLNRLLLNVLWSQKDNFLDIPMDCPQRDERLGWTGDAGVFSETACYNMFVPAFFRKYLWDMRAEQSVLNGAVPNVVPRLKKGMVSEYGSSPWADAGVIISWNLYQHYGSKSLLKECYSGMKQWVECQRLHEETLGGKHLIKDGFHFADWLALDHEEPGPFGATDPLFIASVFYYYCSGVVAEAAEILDKKEEAVFYKKLAEAIKTAIAETYFDEEGCCICRTQTGAALSIVYGLHSNEKARRREGERLVQYIEKNGGHLNTGFVGTPILCPALTVSGHHKLAVDLLLNEEFPGWIYEVNMGATTIWERWNSVLPDGHMNPDGMNSLNHYSYGSIVAWLYKDVLGIRPAAPGYRKILLSPHPDKRLGAVRARYESPVGTIKISWKYDLSDRLHYEIDIPYGCECVFRAKEEERELIYGHHSIVL